MESYASNEPRIGIVKTAMGACAQFAVFTYAEMRRTPRYEIKMCIRDRNTAESKKSFITGVGKHNGELISLLDLNSITLEENA